MQADLTGSAIAPSTSRFKEDGFAIVPQVITAREVAELQALLGPATGAGERGLLGRSEIRARANSAHLLDLIRPHLAHEPIPVRAIYFDKSAETNWLVPWHQDLTLALRARIDLPGFGPWTVKDGIPHVQPPVELLQQMLTVRLHLDDADASNGALRVLPSSHRAGRLSAPAIQQHRTERPEFLCAVSAGDAVLMRPLLLHASSRSTSARHRRVLHLEYAAFDLPPGLNWHEAA